LFVTLWEFEVKSGCEELFEKAYGPEGEWVRLSGKMRGIAGRGCCGMWVRRDLCDHRFMAVAGGV
jgi:hypothetical protein